jgi:hypothetical protein
MKDGSTTMGMNGSAHSGKSNFEGKGTRIRMDSNKAQDKD